MRTLVIESDSATAQSIELMLQSEGFNVYTTDLGEEGVDLGKLYDYDIILLDLNLPDISGYEVLTSLRTGKVHTPILILSDLAGVEHKVRGLGCGADDYMTKPFHKDELVARINAIVRRSKGHAQSVIETGELKVNLDTKTVEVNSQRVLLTSKEYQMLELLCLRKGTTLTKEMFLNHLYGGMDEPELKIIDVYITKLRKKLQSATTDGQHYIETVVGKGYTLRDPNPPNTVSPLPGIPSPFEFRVAEGKIALAATSAKPVFPLPSSPRDHTNRLDVCRQLAGDLYKNLQVRKYNTRNEYAGCLRRYLSRLPTRSDDGNILLADAEARTLRNLFSAEVEALPIGFSSALQTLLEHHIGLRVFYPEIEQFYSDVRRGHIATPLPIDAVHGIIQGVREHTPIVFDESVGGAVAYGAESNTVPVQPPDGDATFRDSTQPRPPMDPLGQLDPRKAGDFTVAAIVNSLWRAFLAGEKIHNAAEGWTRAAEVLQPRVKLVLDWLREFMGTGGSGPTFPPG